MQLVTPLQVFGVGFAGGCLLEVLHWYALRKERRLPPYAHNPVYWIVTVLMALAGGGLAVLYFGGRVEAILALHVGISAPLLLQKLSTTVAKTPGGKGARAPGILSFMDW
jgi:uncharacterized membrane protein YjjP (DUF1212 family)